MTQQTPSQQRKIRQAIDALLEDKSSDFRAVVFELCHQLDWPDDEPSFLLAIATNQLEALVRQYPERIAEVMALASEDLAENWQQVQTRLNLTAAQSADAASQVTRQLVEMQRMMDEKLAETEGLLSAERAAMVQAMATERAELRRVLADEQEALADERAQLRRLLAEEGKAMVQRSQALTEQQKEVLEQQTRTLIAQGLDTWVRRSEKLVQQVIKGVRGKHFWEAAACACIAALAIFVTAWMGGTWSSSQAQVPSEWDSFAQWNQQQLKDCRLVDSTTCNFHIKPPTTNN